LVSVLFWSVIAAAFIGPGTVTTAASAGSGYGLALLWALAFSTFACVVLQEAAGRLTLLSGRPLGEALASRFPSGVGRAGVLVLVLGAVVLGCAAYEAGNILGGVSGALMVTGLPRWTLTVAVGLIAAGLLWFNAPRTVAQVLGLVVAVMGVAFLGMAAALAPPVAELLRGLLLPSLPAGAGVLALGLVGTTVVPYNLFLGSGLARGQELGEFRFGLGVAVMLGGIISMGVLVVGTTVTSPFTFDGLAASLADGIGSWAPVLFAIGLFSAGLSSAITAPLAAAITAQTLFGGADDPRWARHGGAYRSVWLGVLLVGVILGLSGVRPVPAIVLAQALNGVVLPGVACFLLLAVNDRELMGGEGINGALSNGAMAIVVGVALLLGTVGVLRAGASAVGTSPPGPGAMLLSGGLVVILVGAPLASAVRRQRARGSGS
jgi:Mn2+/Fe2+ NRAMP family transporter